MWYYQNDQRTPSERVIPDGKIDLIFHFGDPMTRTADDKSLLNPLANLVGPMTQPYEIEPMGKSHMIGVRLNAASAQNFFQFELGTIQNKVIDLADVWFPGCVNNILQCEDQLMRVKLIKAALLSRSKESRFNWLSDALEFTGAVGFPTVDAWARSTGYSVRYLEKAFKRTLGMTPRQFLSITRVQATIDTHRQNPTISMSKLAYMHGFSDQSHFNKDFIRYIGTTPKRFFRESHPMLDTTQS